ncbi:sensor histidine kinase [Abyssalbus ytuae]|uniref:Histidine kinase n=1 Tax=Abyssalbus ytuae TaxID=2926907 RepID=A0A9E7CTX9_9FLAO|nr:histidine kinase [Abyssalbus ytuae]UOB18941.1 histidine kinase [Abyssalbus ytuae]
MFSFDKEYKGWSLERISRHILYWGFWLSFYCIVNGSQYGNRYVEWFLFEALIMTVKLPYAYFVTYYLLPKFLPDKKYVLLGISVLLSALVAVVFILLIYNHFPYTMKDEESILWSGKTFYRILDLIYIASLVVIIKLVQEYYRQKRANTQLREEKINAELQILRNQLQPHFLFNTLNNINSLIISNDNRASNAVLKLSDMLSYMLYDCNVDQVMMGKEVDLIKNYMQLEKIRYGDRLELSFQVSGEIHQRFIAPLLLMPFVENAFKHGIAKSEKKSWIRIYLDVTGDDLSFMVENSLPEEFENDFPRLKSGIGLDNLKKRLKLLYPNRYSISSNTHDSYLINLKIHL